MQNDTSFLPVEICTTLIAKGIALKSPNYTCRAKQGLMGNAFTVIGQKGVVFKSDRPEKVAAEFYRINRVDDVFWAIQDALSEQKEQG